MAKSNIKELDKILHKLKKRSGKEDVNEEMMIALNDLAYALYRNEPERTEEYARQALAIAEKLGDENGIARSHQCIGVSYTARGIDKEGLEYNLKALDFYERLDKKVGIADSCNNIGYIYSNRGDNDKALEYLFRGLDLVKELDIKTEIANKYNTIGIIYHEMGDFDNALEYLVNALMLYEEFGSDVDKINPYLNIGTVYYMWDDFTKASEYFLKALEIAKEYDDKRSECICLHNIGDVHVQLKQYDDAAKYLKRSLELAIETDNSRMQALNYEFLSNLYQVQGDYEASLINFKLFSELKAEIFSVESSEKIAQLEMNYEIERNEKEAEIFRLKNIELETMVGERTAKLEDEIIERKRADEALRSSEERYKALFEASADGIEILDDKGFIIACNTPHAEMLGYEISEIVGKHTIDFFVEESKVFFREKFPLVKTTGKADAEISLVNKDGTIIPVWRKAVAEYNEQGEFVGAVNYNRDITKRKRAEEAQNILLNIATAVSTCENLDELYPVIHDNLSRILDTTNFFITFYNEERRTLSFPYHADEYDDYDEYDELPVEGSNCDYIIRTGEALLADRDTFADLDARGEIITNENLTRPLVWLGVPLKRGDEIFGVIVVQSYTDPFAYNEHDKELLQLVSHQITNAIDSVRAEEALLESEEKYRSMMESMEGLIYICSMDYKIEFMNSAMIGRVGRDATGECCYKALHNLDKVCSWCTNDKIQQGESQKWEITNPTDGQTFHISNTPIFHLNGTISKMTIERDFSDRKRAEDILRLQRDLEESLSLIVDMDEAVELCLNAAIEAGGMDSGGIYLVDEITGDLDLAYSKRLPTYFTEAASHYDAKSQSAKMVMAGKPIYTVYSEIGTIRRRYQKDEELQAVALIPVSYEGTVIACLNVASYTMDEVPTSSHDALEAIATQLGGVITRIRTENALHESEERYRSLIVNAPLGVVSCDLNGRILAVNPAMLKVLGSPSIEKTKEINVLEFQPMIDAGISNAIKNCMRSGKNVELECEYTTFWGEFTYLAYYFSPIRNDDNDIIGCQGLVADIMDRKQVEEALRESEEHYRSLQENIPVGLFRTTPKGEFIAANTALANMMGYETVEERAGFSVADYYASPEGRHDFVTRIEKDGSLVDYETQLKRKDGTLIWVSFNCQVVTNDNGDIIYYDGIVEDITERKQAKEELLKSEVKFKELANLLPQTVFEIDLTGNLTYVNQFGLKHFGYSQQEVEKGLNVAVIMVPEEMERTQLIISKVLAGEKNDDYEFEFLRKDGSTFFGATYPMPIIQDNIPVGVRGILIDNTERKQAEETLRESHERFLTVLDSLEAAVYVADMETYEVLYINQHLRNIFGDVEGKICWEVLQTDQTGPCDFCTNDKIVNGDADPNGVYSWEFQNSTNGIWYAVRDRAIRWIDGRVVRLEIAFDITERKQAEEKLRQSEEKYRSLIETTNTGYLIVDKVGTVIDANTEYVRLTGYRKLEEIIDRNVIEWTAEYDKDRNAKEINICLQQGFVKGLEVDYTDESGLITPIEVNAKVVKLKGEVRILALCRDITERKRAEDALRESEEKYRMMMETMKDMVYICSSDLHIEYMNPAMIDEIGRDAGGGSCFEVISGLNEKCPWCIIDNIVSGESMEYELTSPRNNRTYLVSNSPIHRADGTVSKQTMLTDITERKLAEEAIQLKNYELKERVKELNCIYGISNLIEKPDIKLPEILQGVVDLIPLSWQYSDITCARITFGNDTYSSDNFKETQWHQTADIISNEDKVGSVDVYYLEAKPENAEGPFLNEERLLLNAIVERLGRMVERNLAEEQIQTSLAEKDFLLKEIHHRVKNSLNVISSLLNLQAESVEDKTVKYALEESRNRIRTMVLIHDKLYRSDDLTRIELGDYIKGLMGELTKSYAVHPSAMDLKVSVKDVYLTIDTAIPCGMIINELVTNSLKYAYPEDNEGAITVEMHSIGDDEIELVVADDGVGFPVDFDIEKADTLGMQIVHALVLQLEGTIELDKSSGTKFIIRFRIDENEQ